MLPFIAHGSRCSRLPIAMAPTDKPILHSRERTASFPWDIGPNVASSRHITAKGMSRDGMRNVPYDCLAAVLGGQNCANC